MKRPHSDDVGTPPFKKSGTAEEPDRLEDLLHQIQEPENIQDVEKDTLEDLKANLGSFSHTYQKEVTDATQNYYYIYIKKTLQEMPLFKELFKFNPQLIHEKSNFMQLFVLARTVVNCNLKIKKYIALNNFANAATSIVGKTLHDQFIIPLLRDVIPLKVLHSAMSEFQNEISKSTEPDQIQCVLYFIEKQLEDEEPKTVYHPLTQCVAGQINASSKYIQTIIKEAAFTFIKQMTHDGREEVPARDPLKNSPWPTPSWPEPTTPWPSWPEPKGSESTPDRPEKGASLKSPVTSEKSLDSPQTEALQSPESKLVEALQSPESKPAEALQSRESKPAKALQSRESKPAEALQSPESKPTPTFTSMTESEPSNPIISMTFTDSKSNVSPNAKNSKSTNILKKKEHNTLKKSESATLSIGKNSKYPF